MLRLYYTPNSPYARIARVFAIEAGVMHRIELVETSLRDPESNLLPVSPIGRVPTLLTEQGFLITETPLVCGWLDTLHDGPKLMPMQSPDRMQRIRIEGVASGFMEGVAVFLRELRRPPHERSPGVIALEQERMGRALDWFEREAAAGGLDHPIHIGLIRLACAIRIVDLRHPEVRWGEGRPSLAEWFHAFSARPSMRATEPTA